MVNYFTTFFMLQQHLPPAVCAEGCETAEEQSDDEVRTSQVPEQSEGKTKMMKQQYLPFTVLKLTVLRRYSSLCFVATTPTACGSETGQLIPKYLLYLWSCNNTYCLRYWNLPNVNLSAIRISLVATTPTVYGMRRRVRDSRGAKRRWGPHISSTWAKRR